MRVALCFQTHVCYMEGFFYDTITKNNAFMTFVQVLNVTDTIFLFCVQ